MTIPVGTARPHSDPASVMRLLGTWHRGFAAVALGWMVVGVGITVAYARGVPVSWWACVHAFTLGAITTMILVYTQHFAGALSRTREDAGEAVRGVAWRVGLVQAGICCLLLGRAGYEWSGLADFGAILIVVALTAHCGYIFQTLRSGMAGRRSYLVRYYAIAGVWAIVAIVVALMATHTVGGYDLAIAAHSRAMIWGFVMPTVLVSVITLVPTFAKTKVSATALTRARWCLRAYFVLIAVAQACLLLAACGLGRGADSSQQAGGTQSDLAARLSMMAGLSEVGAALAVAVLIAVAVIPAARSRAGSDQDRGVIGIYAGLAWLLVCLLADGLGLACVVPPRDLFGILAPVLLAAGIMPMIIQVLGFLVPTLAGGGMELVRARRRRAGISAGFRQVIIGSGALCILGASTLTYLSSRHDGMGALSDSLQLAGAALMGCGVCAGVALVIWANLAGVPAVERNSGSRDGA